MQKKYRVIVTETHSSEYWVGATDEEDAIKEVLTGTHEPKHTKYNETNRDRDSMYVVEMKPLLYTEEKTWDNNIRLHGVTADDNIIRGKFKR